MKPLASKDFSFQGSTQEPDYGTESTVTCGIVLGDKGKLSRLPYKYTDVLRNPDFASLILEGVAKMAFSNSNNNT